MNEFEKTLLDRMASIDSRIRQVGPQYSLILEQDLLRKVLEDYRKNNHSKPERIDELTATTIRTMNELGLCAGVDTAAIHEIVRAAAGLALKLNGGHP